MDNLRQVLLFNQQVLRRRQAVSKLWSTLLIFALLFLHSITSNLNSLFSFRQIFIQPIYGVFRIQFWTYSFLILIINWVLFAFYDKLYTVSLKVYSNRFHRLFEITNSLQSVCIIANVVCSIFISSMLLELYVSKENLNSYYISGFIGFSVFLYRLQFAYNDSFLLDWPLIERSKFYRFKSKTFTIVTNVFKSLIRNFLIWQLIYWTIGSSNPSPIDNEYSWFWTILASFKLGFIVLFSNAISWQLYQILMTEIYHFELKPRDVNQLSLSSALSLNSHPYIQTLGFIDLCYLSVNPDTRRQKIFTLNFQTNQPQYWPKISGEAMNVIKGFIDVFYFEEMLHGNASSSRPFSKHLDLINRKTVTSPIMSPVRDYKSPGKDITSTNRFLTSVVDKLKSKKLFAYIYGENPDYKTQRLLVDSCLVVHALKVLSNLAVASFAEDEFGIVQQNLGEIITLFMELNKTLEKFNTNKLSFRQLQRAKANSHELNIQKLIFILNESIYKIVHTFGTSLKSLMIDEDVMRRLQKHYLTQ